MEKVCHGKRLNCLNNFMPDILSLPLQVDLLYKCIVKICVAKRTSLIATCDISMGEKGFQERTSSAEEVIDIYPNMFNFYQEFGCHYDISEAHQIL